MERLRDGRFDRNFQRDSPWGQVLGSAIEEQQEDSE